MKLVQTKALTKTYTGAPALDDCTMSVCSGEVFGLLGPNGAGKTTLLRLLLGYLRPTSGWAAIASYDCHAQSLEVRRRTAYMPGEARLFPRMSGREVLRFFAGVRPGADMARSLKIAHRLDLDLSRRVAFMSTGMKQKLALAATLAAPVSLLILDEPTANLDPTVRGEVLALVSEAKGDGRTVLFSSHVLSEAEEVCDQVVIMRKGRLVHTEALAELRRRHSIALRLGAELPAIPPELADSINVSLEHDGQIVIEAAGELPPVLRWLASLPVTEMQVQPVGLRAIYHHWQGPSAFSSAAGG